MSVLYAQVIVDIVHENVAHTFTYRIPDGMTLTAGQRVEVPFGRMRKEGVVLSLTQETDVPPEKLRDILRSESARVNRKNIILQKFIIFIFKLGKPFSIGVYNLKKLLTRHTAGYLWTNKVVSFFDICIISFKRLPHLLTPLYTSELIMFLNYIIFSS